MINLELSSLRIVLGQAELSRYFNSSELSRYIRHSLAFDSREFIILFHIIFHVDHIALNCTYLFPVSVDLPFVEDIAKRNTELQRP